MAKIFVLIVDDNEIDRMLLRRDLDAIGFDYEAVEKTNGLEAINYLKDAYNQQLQSSEASPPAIIFLDINMHIMNGHEFLEAFCEFSRDNDIQPSTVLMFSSSNDSHDVAMSQAYDCVACHLVKGQYSDAELSSAIHQALTKA